MEAEVGPELPLTSQDGAPAPHFAGPGSRLSNTRLTHWIDPLCPQVVIAPPFVHLGYVRDHVRPDIGESRLIYRAPRAHGPLGGRSHGLVASK
jgi:hypothetical protein